MKTENQKFSLNDLLLLCDTNVSLERVIETKRSRRKGESDEAYKSVKPLKQTVKFNFSNITLREVFERCLAALTVTYQNGTSRAKCDSLDKDANFTGDGWQGWLKANPTFTVDVNSLRSGASKSEIPIEQRIAAMTPDQLIAAFSSNPAALRAIQSAIAAKENEVSK